MRFATAIVLIFITSNVFAQDKIIRTNGDTITGYISEVQKEEIRYRKVDDRSEPVYTIKKTLVDRVVYESGEVEKIELPKEALAADRYNFRHRIQWVYTDVFIARLHFAYEYLNKSGRLGIRVPVGVGVTPAFNSGLFGLSAISGVDLNIYPTTARGLAKYYFGPMFRVGYTEADLIQGEENVYFSLLFGNGVSVNVLPELNISAYLGLGIKYTQYLNNFYYYDNMGNPYYDNRGVIYPHAVFGLSVGYNFIRK